MDLKVREKLQNMRNLRDKQDELTAQIGAIKEELKHLNYELVSEFERLGMQNVSLPGIGKFFIETKTHPTIQNHAILEPWLKDKGDYDMLLTFNTNKFKSYYKSLLEGNEELPPGVNQFVDTKLKMSKNA